MPRKIQLEGIRILKFFEEEPIEKAEVLFAIVAEKMRARSIQAGTYKLPKKPKAPCAPRPAPPAPTS